MKEITKGGPYKTGKTIKCKSTKFKTMKLPLAVIKNYNCGVIRVKVYVDLYGFKSVEAFLIIPKNAKIANKNE